MKLPAVAITAAFASGIALGLHSAIATHTASRQLLLASFLATAVFVFAGMPFMKIGWLFPSACASLLSWIFLGVLGACVAHQPRPAEHVVSLVEQGRIDLKTPLRWHGHLSDEPAKADILKIGHHGSKNSTTTEFLAAVRPQVGIISAREFNPYGHPSPELLERPEKAGVRILRTVRDGAVHILTDGTRLEITCFVTCPESSGAPASVRTQTPN